MKRLPNWRSRLDRVVKNILLRPVEYGEHDCAMFPANCVLAITGEDLAAQFRGKYHSLSEARALLKTLGCNSPAEYAATVLPQMEPAFARSGDLAVIVDEDGSERLGLLSGERVGVVMREGYGTLSRDKMIRALRVG